MTRVADTRPVWKALETRLAFLHTGRLLGPDRVSQQLREEAQEKDLGFLHITDPVGFDACPEVPTLVLVTGFEEIRSGRRRCEQLSNWRAAVHALLPRCAEARVLLHSRVPKTSLAGCPGSQLIIDATPAFIAADPDAMVAEATAACDLPAQEVEKWCNWYGHRPGLVLAVIQQANVAAGRKERLAAADEHALAEYVAAFEELGPDVLATLDHYVTELNELTLDFRDLDGSVVEALRGGGFVETIDDGRTISLLPGSDRHRMKEALRTVVDSTTQLPSGYLQSLDNLWWVERSLRAEFQRLLIERHGRDQWTARVPGDRELHDRLVSRAAQEAFPRAKSCRDLPNPLEWLTMRELIDLILSEGEIRPFGVSDRVWHKMNIELSPVRDRIAHMRLLREGDQQLVARWQRQISRFAEIRPISGG